jgi:hypothetical protein
MVIGALTRGIRERMETPDEYGMKTHGDRAA